MAAIPSRKIEMQAPVTVIVDLNSRHSATVEVLDNVLQGFTRILSPGDTFILCNLKIKILESRKVEITGEVTVSGDIEFNYR